MTGETVPPASAVPRLLEGGGSPDAVFTGWLRNLLRIRSQFGITRIGSITRLDRVGIPVVQVVRPLALSNAVSQGKGLSWEQAAASGLMEAIETWAAERIPESRLTQAPIGAVGPADCAMFRPWLSHEATADWEGRSIGWIDGWNLFTDRIVPVPAALVDTAYTLPSPHPPMFPRTTTGLGAGASFIQAVIQAGFEVLERDAVAKARRIPNFFDAWQIDPAGIGGEACSRLLSLIRGAGLLCGAWRAPAPHDLPVYWCHVMESGSPSELVPLPSEGFGCDMADNLALAKALLEACQARAAAISGAREDITRQHYPTAYDREHLAEWREQLSAPRRLRLLPPSADRQDLSELERFDEMIKALHGAGAEAAIVVPLFSDEVNKIHAVRLVAPPLRLNPREAG